MGRVDDGKVEREEIGVDIDGLGLEIEMGNQEGLRWRIEAAPGSCSPERILAVMVSSQSELLAEGALC